MNPLFAYMRSYVSSGRSRAALLHEPWPPPVRKGNHSLQEGVRSKGAGSKEGGENVRACRQASPFWHFRQRFTTACCVVGAAAPGSRIAALASSQWLLCLAGRCHQHWPLEKPTRLTFPGTVQMAQLWSGRLGPGACGQRHWHITPKASCSPSDSTAGVSACGASQGTPEVA